MAQRYRPKRSVMIIDEDVGYAASLADLLRLKGYAASSIATPEHALGELGRAHKGSGPAPVVLIDAELGVVASRGELVALLRAARPELIFVLMTGYLDGPTAMAAMRRGVCDYFDKSGDPKLLYAVLERCLDRAQLEFEREAAYASLRLAKEAAEAANRAKSEFLATMSHELRTPLNAIIGFSEMIQRELLGPLLREQYLGYVGDIHDSGMHLLAIINDILDLSKAESGKLELHEDVFDLHDTVRAVRQLIRGRIDDGGLSDAIALPADLPLLRADERKTKQVLLNLASNAVKFTPSGGHIEIAARFDRERGIILTVSDTGIGIAPGDLARVLEPFEQVDTAYTRSRQGTGLGLPLAKAIMERHGGSLAVNSKLDAGTQVSVIFPPRRAVFVPLAINSLSAA